MRYPDSRMRFIVSLESLSVSSPPAVSVLHLLNEAWHPFVQESCIIACSMIEMQS